MARRRRRRGRARCRSMEAVDVKSDDEPEAGRLDPRIPAKRWPLRRRLIAAPVPRPGTSQGTSQELPEARQRADRRRPRGLPRELLDGEVEEQPAQQDQGACVGAGEPRRLFHQARLPHSVAASDALAADVAAGAVEADGQLRQAAPCARRPSERSDGAAAVEEPSRHASSGASLDARLNSMGNGTCRRLNAAAGVARRRRRGPTERPSRSGRAPPLPSPPHAARKRRSPAGSARRAAAACWSVRRPAAAAGDDAAHPSACGSSVEDWSKLQLDLGNQSTRAGSAAVQSGGFDTTDLAIAAAATTVREADSLHTRRRRHRSLKARSEGRRCRPPPRRRRRRSPRRSTPATTPAIATTPARSPPTTTTTSPTTTGRTSRRARARS